MLSTAEAGSKFIFTISDVQNPYSMEESTSISYLVKTSDGYLVEDESGLLTVENSYPGEIAYTSAEILPASFTRGKETTYSLNFVPLGYE